MELEAGKGCLTFGGLGTDQMNGIVALCMVLSLPVVNELGFYRADDMTSGCPRGTWEELQC